MNYLQYMCGQTMKRPNVCLARTGKTPPVVSSVTSCMKLGSAL